MADTVTIGGVVHKGGLEEHQVSGGKQASREMGNVDIAEPMPQTGAQQDPPTIMVGSLPAEQPCCPHCGFGLHPVRQNSAGDSLFECLTGGCVGDGYMAIYRLAGPRWEQFQGRGIVEGWKQPLRYADVLRLQQEAAKGGQAAAAPAPPAEKPKGAWPGEQAEGGDDKVEPVAESKSVQRRKAIQKAGKAGA